MTYKMCIRDSYYTVDTLDGPKRLQMEVQIRTMAMNFWATVEHSLQYKYKRNIPEHIKERLLSAADAIITLDNEMSTVRSEIMDAQISFRIQANIVADILNNIQNQMCIRDRNRCSGSQRHQ